jgi:hypothetical protein
MPYITVINYTIHLTVYMRFVVFLCVFLTTKIVSFHLMIASIPYIAEISLISDRFMPLLVKSDYVYIILGVGTFAITNGWYSSLAMMQGPLRVTEGGSRGKEIAGNMMILSLTAGLASGSVLSFATRSLVN